jgi:chorismate mutase
MCGCRPERSKAPPAPPVATTTATQDATLDELVNLMRERLLLMHEVAKWKWNAGKAITDASREWQLLADLEQRGLAHGLSRERTRAFMAAQIEAAKLIQEADFTLWKEAGQDKFDEVRDLDSDLRPLIDELSDKMLAQLSRLLLASAGLQDDVDLEQRAKAVLRGNGIDDDVRAVAIRALREPNRGEMLP